MSGAVYPGVPPIPALVVLSYGSLNSCAQINITCVAIRSARTQGQNRIKRLKPSNPLNRFPFWTCNIYNCLIPLWSTKQFTFWRKTGRTGGRVGFRLSAETQHIGECAKMHNIAHTSSTAQGGGGSFRIGNL